MIIFSSIAKKKQATAFCILKKGTGQILVNNKIYTDYFLTLNLFVKNLIIYPFILLKLDNTIYDIILKVKGGGLYSQVQASILAISKILSKFNSLYKKILNQYNLCKIDNRKVERKKYGLKKARKASQYSKR